MIKRIKSRLSGGGGFTFAEFMIAMLILMLSGSLIITALNISNSQFQRSSNQSAAQMLLNTLTTTVRDELSAVSGTVTKDDDDRLLTFTSNAYDADMLRCRFVAGTYTDSTHVDESERGEIMLKYTYVDGSVFYYPLLNSKDYADDSGSLSAGLTVTCDSAHQCFNVALSIYSEDGEALASGSCTVTPILSVNGL